MRLAKFVRYLPQGVFLLLLGTLLLLAPVFRGVSLAGNYGSSMEGDSTVVTYVHHVAADSAHARFAFGEAAPYDSAHLYPISGSSNAVLVAGDKLDLDSVGTHLVTVRVWIGGAVADTSIGAWRHEDDALVLDTLRYQSDMLEMLTVFFGACDGCYVRMYPEGGAANKDSAVVIDPSMGADSLRGKVVWYHGTVPSVYDTSAFYYDEPW